MSLETTSLGQAVVHCKCLQGFRGMGAEISIFIGIACNPKHIQKPASTLRSLLNKIACFRIVTIVKLATWFNKDLRVSEKSRFSVLFKSFF